MDWKLSRHLFLPACFLLVASVLANNLAISSDPYASRWGPEPEIMDDTILHMVTFQIDAGDQLYIDVDSLTRSYSRDYDRQTADVHYQVRVFDTPRGDSIPSIQADQQMRGFNGTESWTAAGSNWFATTPGEWRVRPDGWATLVMSVTFDDGLPANEAAREAFAENLHRTFLAPGAFDEDDAYQRVPALALKLQPWFNGAHAVLIVALAVAAVAHLWPQPREDGLSAQLDLAIKARQWLASVRNILFTMLIGLVLTGVMAWFALGEGQFIIHHGLDPGTGYHQRMPALLTIGIGAAIAGLVVFAGRIHRAVRNIPEFDLDA